MNNYLNYAPLANPATCVLLLDEEAQAIFGSMEDECFDPSVTGSFNVEGDEDYNEDPGISDYTSDDFGGALDCLDIEADEFIEAECDVEGYGELIDMVMGLED